MSTGRIDVHAHLLPAIDDGCPGLDDSLNCARALVAAGYSHAFCTPHIWPTFPNNTMANIRTWTNQLQQAYDGTHVSLRLIPGGEINLQQLWPAMAALPREQIVTYAFAGRYVLFDFWANSWPAFLTPAIAHLWSLDLVPIMAHPERILALQTDPTAVDRLLKMGVLLQLNTWTLTDPPHSPTRLMAERLLRNDQYFLFGTDTHNFASIQPRIDGLARAEELVGSEVVERCTVINPRQLMGDTN